MMITKANTPLEDVFRLIKPQKSALKKLGIVTVRDLLFHFPARYESVADETLISLLKKGQHATFHGVVGDVKKTRAFRKKMVMTEATLRDHTGAIKALWFHQPYIVDKLKDGATFRFSGKIGERNGKLYVANPEFEQSYHSHEGEPALQNEKTMLYPVYPESRGVTSKWFYHAIKKLLREKTHVRIDDPIPTDILKKYSLPKLQTALVWIHNPKKDSHSVSARKRFAFEEVFFIQLSRQKMRHEYRSNDSYTILSDKKHAGTFYDRFPFTLTHAQKSAIETILADFQKKEPMSRLLEGDVGSGKTAVAATAAYSVVTSRPNGQNFGNLQVAYMAPTEILAQQHFESFMEYFSHLPIQIGLITGSGCKKFPSKIYAEHTRTTRGAAAEKITPWTDISRAQLLKWVKNGEIPILIGTHALIQKSVSFKHLAFVIIDEQHRFGVQQRARLVARGTHAEHTRNVAEKNDFLLYKDLTYSIRQALFDIKKILGGGHKEVVYQKALEKELGTRKIPFSKEKQIPVMYRGRRVGTYIPDFVIDEKIIVELKTLPFIGAREKKQVWTYLKGSSYRLALLANYGPQELTVERVIYDSARSASVPHSSACVPRSSACVPHLLSMTATPIPRTLALTVFGDLDLTLLDEMPAGRKRVITEIISPDNRSAAYGEIGKQLAEGRQLYVICPRINEPDPKKWNALNVKSVKAEAHRLKKEIFPQYEIEILHSKMRPAEKENVMKRFSDGNINILVSTSVVEVGVNVPNATMIVIEGAERFGLAQLHQLRGRVLRSTHQAYCYIFADSKSKKSIERLRAITKAQNGFELAELDLKLRGGGELSGRRQWGISDIGMEAIKNIKMVEAARAEAQDIIEKDPEFAEHPLINERLLRTEKNIHFE